MMANFGILGEYKGSQAREVIMSREEYERACSESDQDQDEYEQPDEEIEIEDESEEPDDEQGNLNEGQRGYIAVNNELD